MEMGSLGQLRRSVANYEILIRKCSRHTLSAGVLVSLRLMLSLRVSSWAVQSSMMPRDKRNISPVWKKHLSFHLCKKVEQS